MEKSLVTAFVLTLCFLGASCQLNVQNRTSTSVYEDPTNVSSTCDIIPNLNNMREYRRECMSNKGRKGKEHDYYYYYDYYWYCDNDYDCNYYDYEPDYSWPSGGDVPDDGNNNNQQGQNQNPSVPNSQPSLPPANNGDYCAISQRHTMCRFSGLSSSCSRNLVSNFRGLSEAGKRIILDRHNELRSRVAQGQERNQPSASNMRKLVWNDELAVIAQRWADQCTFGHDPERSKLDRTSVGQNVATFSNSRKFSWAEIESSYLAQSAQNWYDEVTNPGFSRWNIKPFQFSSGTGHYTQVVWAETREVGCGLVYYLDGSWYTTLVVCNYAVAGNMAGGEMYKEGRSCSSCPVSGSGCQDGLCLG